MRDITKRSRRDIKKGGRHPDIKRKGSGKWCARCGYSAGHGTAGHTTAMRQRPPAMETQRHAALRLAKQAYSHREIAAHTGLTVRQVASVLAVRKPKRLNAHRNADGKVLVWGVTPDGSGKHFVGTMGWPYRIAAVLNAFGPGLYDIESYPPKAAGPKMRVTLRVASGKCALCTCTGVPCNCAHGAHAPTNVRGSVDAGLLPHLGGSHCPCKECRAAAVPTGPCTICGSATHRSVHHTGVLYPTKAVVVQAGAPAGIGLAAAVWAADNGMPNAAAHGAPVRVGNGWAVTVMDAKGQLACCTFMPGPDMDSSWVRDMYERLDRII